MSTLNSQFQSRWGFHPCERNLFLKLKHLHKWYWRTMYDFHRWHRWWRKESQNRIGAEPACCPIFIADQPWYKPVRTHGVDGFKVYPKSVIDFGIVGLFQAARLPQAEPVAPFDAATVAKIEELYSLLIADRATDRAK